jgi:hypothetical protein
MDANRFDAWIKALGRRPSRRHLLRGLLGLGGGAVAATVTTREADAQWSVQVCLPNGSGGYTSRLVPKSSVPLYQQRYGAILPTNGSCSVCQPGLTSCGGVCKLGDGQGCTTAAACCSGECISGICGPPVPCGPFLTRNSQGNCVDPCTPSPCANALCAVTPGGTALCLKSGEITCTECVSDAGCLDEDYPFCLQIGDLCLNNSTVCAGSLVPAS